MADCWLFLGTWLSCA